FLEFRGSAPTNPSSNLREGSVLGSQCYLTLGLSFQSMMKEECSSCLQPVSSMECVAANKVLLHHSCFCCKLCKRKLSLHNYTALHGAFYCKVHYQQLAKARGGSKKEKIEYPLIHIHISAWGHLMERGSCAVSLSRETSSELAGRL
uniref:LIM zinc-binding domain-containing protein n=1 Tax=Terrapene triunguis TaxID=2587831 RepID=A0A674J358_9SAUR